MIEKTASVHWEGAGKKGVGKISTQTGALKDYPYGFGSRFEDDRRGTNPEEILGLDQGVTPAKVRCDVDHALQRSCAAANRGRHGPWRVTKHAEEPLP